MNKLFSLNPECPIFIVYMRVFREIKVRIFEVLLYKGYRRFGQF